MALGTVRQKWAHGQPVHCYKTNIPHSMMPEIIGSEGIDCLWIDFEHFPTSDETAFGLLQACRAAGMDSMMRVPHGDLTRAARLLDSGASGILYPRCKSAEEIEAMVRWLRYPPQGERGIDTGVAAAHFSAISIEEQIEWANEHVFLAAIIETGEAIEQLDAIAALPGLDMLFLGPADLSLSMGIDRNMRSGPMLDCVQRLAETAVRHNKAWGAPAMSVEHAGELLDLGARFIAMGSDSSQIRQTLRTMKDNLRPLGISYRGDDH